MFWQLYVGVDEMVVFSHEAFPKDIGAFSPHFPWALYPLSWLALTVNLTEPWVIGNEILNQGIA